MAKLPTKLLAAAIAVLNCLVILAVVNSLIGRKQAIVDTGQTVFLELAPVDPRSLMQGDYMALAYALPRSEAFLAATDETETATRGRVILALDERRVGTFARFDTAEGDSPGQGEAVLKFRKWRRGWRFGIESFFFEEGMAGVYDRARFAELRVSPDGRAVLVDLVGEDLGPLGQEDAPASEAVGEGEPTDDPPGEDPPP